MQRTDRMSKETEYRQYKVSVLRYFHHLWRVSFISTTNGLHVIVFL